MLSASDTITDIKAKLKNGFAFYGIADDPTFTEILTENVDNIVRTEMYPALSSMRSNVFLTHNNLSPDNNLTTGKSIYDSIALKDKIDLTVTEEYIYWAEVFFAMSDFLDQLDSDSQYSINGENVSISTKGYSSSVSGGTRNTGKNNISVKYHSEGKRLMTQSGSVINSNYRGGR